MRFLISVLRNKTVWGWGWDVKDKMIFFTNWTCVRSHLLLKKLWVVVACSHEMEEAYHFQPPTKRGRGWSGWVGEVEKEKSNVVAKRWHITNMCVQRVVENEEAWKNTSVHSSQQPNLVSRLHWSLLKRGFVITIYFKKVEGGSCSGPGHKRRVFSG